MQPARSRILFVCLLQSLALVLLLVGARHGWLPLYLALPLGVVLLWLPWLLPGNRTAVATVGEPDIARLARDLSHNTSQNALSAAGVAFSVKRLAEKLQSQLDAAEQIVGSAEVMIHTERATSNLARQAMDAATRARAGSDEGQVLLASTIERMHRLSERMGASREAIEALNQRSEDIQRVTLVIQGIASQTNLLALNAAIEAARAGEHGRGFAVVAEEVRGLAGRTAEATEEVGQMVAEIQRQTSEVVEQIRQLSEELGEGVGQVELTGRQLEGIAELAAGVESQITEIAQGAEINRSQLASLFAAVEQVRGDLSASEEQTLRLGEAASQLENQAEVISERLAEVRPGRLPPVGLRPRPGGRGGYRRSLRGGRAQRAHRPRRPVRPQLPAVAQYPADQVPDPLRQLHRPGPAGHPGAVAGAQPQPGIRHRLYPRRLRAHPQSRLRPSAQRRPADGRVAQPQQAPVQRPHRDSLRQPPAAAVATDLHP
ncbi:putative chemotaxis transducer [Pseudomonas aeruginosa]|nr:putative chemotaxis transducer [Pseudomonas aeruginosa]